MNIKLHAQKTGVLTFCLVFLLSTFLPQLGVYRLQIDEPSDSEAIAKIEENYGKVPLTFEKNVGQTDEQVAFLNRAGTTTTYFTPTETVFVRSQDIGDKENPELVSDTLRMSLNNANTNPKINGLNKQENKSNYFIGNSEEDWQTDVTNYEQVKYAEVYPGIDLVYYGNNDKLEHDFVVSPGTDPNQISFSLDGAKEVYIDDEGNLVAEQDYGNTVFQKPLTYQDSKDNQVETAYEIENKTVKFALGEYDSSRQLVIDPITLEYSTYLGGSGGFLYYDYPNGMAVDSTGYAYVVGYTESTDFPTSSPYQGSNGGSSDAFITKFSLDGSSIVYSTYLGGTSSETGWDIAIDLDGNAYVVGQTYSTNFPTSSPYQASLAGGGDIFVTKLNSSGSSLIFSTYLGGSATEEAREVVIDSSKNVFFAGITQSSDYPTSNPYQASYGGVTDGFITKLNSSGTGLVFSSYLGGSGSDSLSGLDIDLNGNVYVTGDTLSSDFPTSSPYQASNAGSNDIFVTKFSLDGTSLDYSTYLGGSSPDVAEAIRVDSSGNAYLTGSTQSTDFPTFSPYQASNGGFSDVFLTKINPSGSALVYSTYFGGVGGQQGRDLAIDSNNNAYIVGFTNDSSYPVFSEYQDTLNGSHDAILIKFTSDGSAVDYSTFFGGSAYEEGRAVAVDLANNVYITGLTSSSDLPTSNPFQPSHAGGVFDVFITKFTEHSVLVTGQVNPTLTFTVDNTVCELGPVTASTTGTCTHTMTAGTNASNGYVISYLPTSTLTSGSDTITESGATGAASSQGSEQFGLNLKDNATPNIGAEASGGVGVASSNYNTADTFSFTTSGAQVAASSTLSDTTTFTVSYIANVANTTEAGNYSTIQTYNIVASY